MTNTLQVNFKDVITDDDSQLGLYKLNGVIYNLSINLKSGFIKAQSKNSDNCVQESNINGIFKEAMLRYNNLRSNLNELKDGYFYPNAKNWMWVRCKPLGSFVDVDGTKYDLGVYVETNKSYTSAAIVFGDCEGAYLSGDLKYFALTKNGHNDTNFQVYEETRRRASNLGYF